MNTFTFINPTRILFGEGTAAGAADSLAELALSNPILVTDKILLEKGVLDPVFESLGRRDLATFDDVPSDSDVDCVRRAVELARSSSCDGVLAVGGGSVIDTAKVINIGLSLDLDPIEYEGINVLTERLRPLIAIPTTAGTGSEASAVAMIKDKQSAKKLLFGSRYLFADLAILDPSMLLTLPPKLTAATGLDAVTHALEAYVSLGANPISDALSLKALEFLFRYLPLAVENGQDMQARAYTLLASNMAGTAFTNAGVGVVHALAHTVGAKFSVHHGIANAIFLPYGMELNMAAASHRYAEVWNYLCNAFAGCTGADRHLSAKFVRKEEQAESGQLLVGAVRELLDKCKLPTRLRDVSVPQLAEDALQELTGTAMTDPAIMFNPQQATEEELVDILKGAY